LWTQLQLPRIYQKQRSHLLFSPIPEAPLNTGSRYIVTVHDLIPLRFPQTPFSPNALFPLLHPPGSHPSRTYHL
jgi:hypothetical protein